MSGIVYQNGELVSYGPTQGRRLSPESCLSFDYPAQRQIRDEEPDLIVDYGVCVSRNGYPPDLFDIVESKSEMKETPAIDLWPIVSGIDG